MGSKSMLHTDCNRLFGAAWLIHVGRCESINTINDERDLGPGSCIIDKHSIDVRYYVIVRSMIGSILRVTTLANDSPVLSIRPIIHYSNWLWGGLRTLSCRYARPVVVCPQSLSNSCVSVMLMSVVMQQARNQTMDQQKWDLDQFHSTARGKAIVHPAWILGRSPRKYHVTWLSVTHTTFSNIFDTYHTTRLRKWVLRDQEGSCSDLRVSAQVESRLFFCADARRLRRSREAYTSLVRLEPAITCVCLRKSHRLLWPIWEK
jgi:hypothetical protein